MIKNYFKTALRNLWKNKVTSFINLFGLTIGMTAAVFIFLWVQNETAFDNYHPAKDHIYRITNSVQVNKDEAWVWETSPMLMGETALKEIPEVEKAARVIINKWGGPVLNINHKLFSEKTSAYVDKSWFSLFHYDFTAGDAVAFGQNPFTIILTESKAKKYFGEANAIGQVIRVDTVNYTVEGVVKDNPVNSSFRFDVLLQMEGRLSDPRVLKNDKTWNNFGYTTFLQLHPGAGQSLVTTKLNDIINKNRTRHNDIVSLEPLNDMYFESDLQSSDMPHGNKKTAYIFSLLGLLLLIIACINYVNLTTARASLRAREVSVRKIVGAQRGHLFYQFIIESLTISLLSSAVTVLLIQVCLPVFNTVTEKHFELSLTSWMVWQVMLGTLLFATVLNGIYPAVLLSSFRPLNVFRGRSVLKLRDGSIRKGLVVFQFALSMILIIGTIVIYRQLQYIQTTNPGYNVSQVMSIQIPYKSYISLKGDARKAFFTRIKQELQSQSSIAAISSGGSEIVNVQGSSSGNADWDGRDTTYNPTIASLSVDADFRKMFQLQLKTGHWFRPGNEDLHNYILNETAATAFKMYQPVTGQRFTLGGDTGQVIGIVNDFHFKSMHEKIGPIVLSNNQGSDSYIFVKTVPGNIPKAISAAEAVWTKFIANEPFNYTFLDDSFNNLYKADIKTSRLIFIFSIIAIIISALGLFGLAAFTAEQRTKEIGIRKVLGASVQHVATLLSGDFVRLVIIAIVIASPIAWWVMNKWLQDFAYRINITAGIFIVAGALALLVALIAVSFQAIKAAIANPVKSLRTE
ncbi:MAG: ABC transporter permease [Bacteroidota bacterium]|nr:ABC transporter permease [Bacteroidota bacterium]